jgi:hypothetical protein
MHVTKTDHKHLPTSTCQSRSGSCWSPPQAAGACSTLGATAATVSSAGGGVVARDRAIARRTATAGSALDFDKKRRVELLGRIFKFGTHAPRGDRRFLETREQADFKRYSKFRTSR